MSGTDGGQAARVVLERALAALAPSGEPEARAAALAALEAEVRAARAGLEAPGSGGRRLRAELGQRSDFPHIVAWIERASGTDLPALIEGWPGAGRARVAQTVHEASARSRGPWLRVDAWRAPPVWGEVVAAARGGTLLLAEPLALAREAQRALLAALEAAGAEAPRLLAISRWDLSRPGALLHEPLAQRLLVLRLRLDEVPAVSGAGASPAAGAPSAGVGQGRGATLEQVERAAILERLDACAWQQQRTADSLGIDRKTLYRKIRRYGLTPEG